MQVSSLWLTYVSLTLQFRYSSSPWKTHLETLLALPLLTFAGAAEWFSKVTLNSNTGWNWDYVDRPAVCLRHSSRLPIYLSIRYMTISIHRCDNLLASQICPYYFIYLYISIISVQSSLFICAIYIYIVCLVVWPNRTVQDRVANQQSNQKINPPTTHVPHH